MVLAPLVLLLAAAPGGEVKLPLRDYVALVDDAARAGRRPPSDPTVAQLLRHETRLTVDETGRVDFEVVAEAEMRGAALRPVLVALPGPPTRTTVEPAGAALVGRAGEPLALVPVQQGRVTLRALGEAELDESRRLTLPATHAAAVRVTVDFPVGFDWTAPAAVVVQDETAAGRRRVVLTLPSAEPATLDLPARARGAEADKLLARAVAVTLLDVRRDEVRRHELLVHEVQRGEMRVLSARVPPGLVPDVVATDEGAATPIVEGNRYAVPRQKRLTQWGYLGLSARLPLADVVPLPAVEPEVPLRARYLAVASSRVADVKPQPADGWTRVDVSDLPGLVRAEAEALGIFAVWREKPAAGADAVQLVVPPAAPLVDLPILARASTTVVTTEGRVLDREVLTVDGGTAAVELQIGDAEFWSATVAGEAVIPTSTRGVVRVPVAGEAGVRTEVQIITVRSQALPEDGALALRLGSVAGPVLQHTWSVLLPDTRRYRVSDARGLRVVPIAQRVDDSPEHAILSEAPGAVVRGPGGQAVIRGIVFDQQGDVIPGATVQARTGTGPPVQVTTGANGRFLFTNMPSGRWDVSCALPGFMSTRIAARLQPRRTSLVTCRMRVAALEETVEVVAEAPSVESSLMDSDTRSSDSGGVLGGTVGGVVGGTLAYDLDKTLQFSNSLVGGVRPVPVAVPEEGKLLKLSGVVPGPEVSVELEVKKAR